MTFTGTEDTTNPKALKLNGVEGIALALFEKDGTKEIEINKAAVDQPLDGSVEHKLKYKVNMSQHPLYSNQAMQQPH
ncbi:hypothetical protein A6J63_021905 [Yersinia enterocolitica]|nr:hypothetical protein A6J63_021905 [Yersinia enterocolitica]